MDHATLALLWFGLLGVLLVGYAVLDGFDLGVGILHLLLPRDDAERRAALQSIGPLWDGNEVWLVTFGGALFAAFPEAYATLFSGFYTPFMLLLFALIFRAVSIEFRSKRPGRRWRSAWDLAFSAGSTLAAFLFGVAVGNVMLGLPLDVRGDFSGRLGELLNPYASLVGLLVVALFAMHGAIFLQLRCEGELRARARRWSVGGAGLFGALYLAATGLTWLQVPEARANLHRHPALWAVPALGGLAWLNALRCLLRGRPGQAFLSSALLIAALVGLLGLALFPNIVPASNPAHSLTLLEAASSRRTLGIMLIVAGIGMPLVAAYTGVVYWTFRSRVRTGGS